MKSRWTAEINKDVRGLWAIGTSGEQIAEIIAQTHNMTFSRSAIIGRCNRMGWWTPHRAKQGRPVDQPYKRSNQQTGSDGPLVNRLRDFHQPKLIQNTARPLTDIFPTGSRNMKLIDLGPDDCRYPTSPDSATSHLFCGLARVDGSSYCAAHHALCWRSARKAGPVGDILPHGDTVSDKPYSGQADFSASLDVGHEAIRQRVADGGPGWERKA